MPNHVTTICTVTGPHADVLAFAEKHILNDPKHGKHFAFRTVIPRPAILDDTPASHSAELGLAALVGDLVWTDFNRFRNQIPVELLVDAPVAHAPRVRAWLAEHHPEILAAGRQQCAAIAETGYPTWYEWSIANWGTKWDSYDYEDRERGDGRFVFKFETAWSFPKPVFRALARIHPTIVLAIVSFDEMNNFACDGEFNGQNNYRCAKELATPEMYRRVYDRMPEAGE